MNKKILVISSVLVLAGCGASETQIRHKVAGDLNQIVQQRDCETTCALIKAYIATQLK